MESIIAMESRKYNFSTHTGTFKQKKKNNKLNKITFYPRPTTREYVHLVTRAHFRSHDKDGGHAIRSAVPENPMLHANIIALCLIERKLLPLEVLQCGNRNFRPFCPLWPSPWSDDLHIRTRPENRGDMPHVQIWTSYVKVFKSYRPTDIHTDRTKSIRANNTRRFYGGKNFKLQRSLLPSYAPVHFY